MSLEVVSAWLNLFHDYESESRVPSLATWFVILFTEIAMGPNIHTKLR